MGNQDNTYFYPRQISSRFIEEARKRKIGTLRSIKRKFLQEYICKKFLSFSLLLL